MQRDVRPTQIAVVGCAALQRAGTSDKGTFQIDLRVSGVRDLSAESHRTLDVPHRSPIDILIPFRSFVAIEWLRGSKAAEPDACSTSNKKALRSEYCKLSCSCQRRTYVEESIRVALLYQQARRPALQQHLSLASLAPQCATHIDSLLGSLLARDKWTRFLLRLTQYLPGRTVQPLLVAVIRPSARVDDSR